MRDKDGFNDARRAMIIGGLSLDLNGLCQKGQFNPELHNIINKNRVAFEGPYAE